VIPNMMNLRLFGAVCALSLSFSAPTNATSVGDYLIVGYESGTTAVDVSNYELGRVSALPGSAPAVTSPGVAPTVSTTPTYDGNVAIIDTTGEVKLSNVDVYADRGVDCSGTYSNCTDDGDNLSNSQYDEASGAAQRAIGLSPDGINQTQDLSGVTNGIDAVATFLSGLSAGDITGSITTSSGNITTDQTVFLSSGLNILDFSGVGSNDISLQANLIFQGGSDAFAIALVPDGSAFLTSNGNLVIGNGGIGLNNVLLVSTDDTLSFDLSNTIINGVALWDLGALSNSSVNMSLDNVGGCTQLVGGDVDIQNVNLSRCAFDTTVVPVPAAVWLFGSGLIGLVGIARRKKA